MAIKEPNIRAVNMVWVLKLELVLINCTQEAQSD